MNGIGIGFFWSEVSVYWIVGMEGTWIGFFGAKFRVIGS